MVNPDALTVHEQRVDAHIARLDKKIEQLQEQRATPHNRLLLLRSQFELQIWLNSWYRLDKGHETQLGRQIVQEEKMIRAYWEQCYNHCNQLLSKWHQFEGRKIDLSGIELWLTPKQEATYAQA